MRRMRRLLWSLRRRRAGPGIVLLGLGVLVTALMTTLKLTPTATELALAAATDEITIAVNDVAEEILSAGDFDNLVTLERDGSGAVSALITDTARVNTLKARVTKAVTERFADSDITRVSVPLGNLLGGTLLSGRGPRVWLDILSVTNVVTSFRNEFSDAGINQTRHRIILDVDVSLEVLPGGAERGEDSVRTEVIVSETVIVGSVPEAYAAIQQEDINGS